MKYLSPIRTHNGFIDGVEKVLKVAGPLAGDAASLAKLVPGGSAAAGWLDVVSKMQVQGIPPSNAFDWSIEKVAVPGKVTQADGLMHGALFNLPKSMFELLGGRVTGSIAVTFVQTDETVAEANLLAHACIYTNNNQPHWLPADADGKPVTFLELPITPQRNDSPST